MAIKANIVIDQGSDFTAEIQLLDSDGDPYDLSNHTITGSMRKNYASSTAVDFVCTPRQDPTTGFMFVSLDNTVTEDIEPGRYLYDVVVEDAIGTRTRVVEGIATITPGITR